MYDPPRTNTEESEYVELRSEEVQEILGTPPAWLTQWGTLVVFAGMAVLILVAAMVQYPDVVTADILLTTDEPPVEVVAQSSGRVALLAVRENEAVKRDKVLAVLDNTANYQQVLRLDAQVGVWMRTDPDSLVDITPIRNLQLGDIQPVHAAFLVALDNHRFEQTTQSGVSGSNIQAISQQMARLRESIELDRNAEKRALTDIRVAEEFFNKQKDLFNQGVISALELETERKKFSLLEQRLDDVRDNIARKESQISALRQSRNDLSSGAQEGAITTASRLRNALNQLRSAIDDWKQKFLLTAPIDGRVTLNTNFIRANQYVKNGDAILTIVPPAGQEIVGRANLPIAGSGKVENGQEVVIKLESFPYYEFGSLKGIVQAKALVPKENQYLVRVRLPDGLRTTYKQTLPFSPQLQGKAEIITNNKSFLRRVLEQVFAGAR